MYRLYSVVIRSSKIQNIIHDQSLPEYRLSLSIALDGLERLFLATTENTINNNIHLFSKIERDVFCLLP